MGVKTTSPYISGNILESSSVDPVDPMAVTPLKIESLSLSLFSFLAKGDLSVKLIKSLVIVPWSPEDWLAVPWLPNDWSTPTANRSKSKATVVAS